jgi:Xaa-Pro aminopeptidase
MMTTDIEAFRAAQRVAYGCVEAIAAELEPGITEKEACRRMRAWLHARGVNEWFHRPFAWFGDRTAFTGFRTPLAFFPTTRRLERGMPFILDVAPVVDGCTADVGYAGSLGGNAIVDRMLDDLRHHRALIAELVSTHALGDVYDAVADLAHRQGYQIRHRAYPFGVLGHRVARLPPGRSAITIGGFGLRSLLALGRASRVAPTLWNDQIAASRPLPPGMWAVEPHLGFRGVGAKFEELLVVDEAGARWLDDDLPHVRRWQRQENAA